MGAQETEGLENGQVSAHFSGVSDLQNKIYKDCRFCISHKRFCFLGSNGISAEYMDERSVEAGSGCVYGARKKDLEVSGSA